MIVEELCSMQKSVDQVHSILNVSQCTSVVWKLNKLLKCMMKLEWFEYCEK